MDMLKKIFPLSFGASDVANLIIKILIYVVAGAVFGAIIGFFGGIPLIGMIVSIVCSLIDIYCLAGIVIAVLDFLKVLK